MIASAVAMEGKTLTATNLALTSASPSIGACCSSMQTSGVEPA